MTPLLTVAGLIGFAYGAAAWLTALGLPAPDGALTRALDPVTGGLALLAAIALLGDRGRGRPGAAALLVVAGLTAAPLWPRPMPLWMLVPLGAWLAIHMALVHRATPMRLRLAALVAAFLLTMAVSSLVAEALRLTLVYGWSGVHPMPTPTAGAWAVLGVQLLALAEALRPDRRSVEEKVTYIGIGFLVLVALATAVVTLAALQTQVERSLYQQQRMVARNRELIFHYATERLYAQGGSLLRDLEFAALTDRLQKRADPATGRAVFDRLREHLPVRSLRAFRLKAPDGRVLYEDGDFTPADTLWRDSRSAVDLELSWAEGVPFARLHLRVELPGRGHVGDLELETAVPAWEQLVSDTYDLDDTGRMTVCGFDGQTVHCFQSGSGSGVWHPAAGTHAAAAIDAAFNGGTSPDWDPLILDDFGPRPVVAVYGPVGRVGMAMGVAGNGLVMMVTREARAFYAPVRQRWQKIVPALLGIVLVAGLALRRIVRPLVRALRDQEARFRALTVLSSDCYWQTDAAFTLRELVGQNLAASGMQPEHWIGRRFTELPLHGDDRGAVEAMVEAMQRGEEFSEVPVRVVDGERPPTWLVLSGAPQRDERGRFVGYRGVGRDITAQREAEERLRRAQQDLLRAERLASLGSLVAGVSHELNTPIGNCKVAASALADQVAQFQAQVVEGRIKRSDLTEFVGYVRDTTDLLRRGLERAASTIGKFKTVAVDQSSDRRRRFLLDRTVGDIASLLVPVLARRGIGLSVDVPAGIELDSHPGALGQVIDNLVMNAITHAFEGREAGQVHLAAERLPRERVRLTVSDDGHGMSEAVLNHAFEPFFTTRLGVGGSGLGLYIVRNIVHEMLGGSIAAHSQPGQGTWFVLEFPQVSPHTAPPSPEAVRPATPGPGNPLS